MTGDMLTAALAWHQAGCSLVRAATDGTKRPLGPWKRYQQARANEHQLHAWFKDGHPGLGIVCGAVSGNLEVLEFEGAAITNGTLAQFHAAVVRSGLVLPWSTLRTGCVIRSPSGGLHYYFRTPGPALPNTRLATKNGNVLVETRGEGGYVITAPSHGPVHPTGQPYLLLQGGPPTVPLLTIDDRDALLTTARSLDRAHPEARTRTPQAKLGGARPGDDFERRTDWAEILIPAGWALVRTDGHTRYWRRPGKRFGVSATSGNSTARDRLYVFSTSTPFAPQSPYTKFAAYALLSHAGDHRTAARWLRDRGYGSR
ncbi:bifunctional DNA primase/polymerase [Streptomyces sp. NPDC048172]|uniref:bifunctional DNA primase/polymerase n=1 Tax=Streptomyces sp. NPDC048172 TaxID=3365505 RepID=UPI00371DEF8A